MSSLVYKNPIHLDVVDRYLRRMGEKRFQTKLHKVRFVFFIFPWLYMWADCASHTVSCFIYISRESWVSVSITTVRFMMFANNRMRWDFATYVSKCANWHSDSGNGYIDHYFGNQIRHFGLRVIHHIFQNGDWDICILMTLSISCYRTLPTRILPTRTLPTRILPIRSIPIRPLPTYDITHPDITQSLPINSK